MPVPADTAPDLARYLAELESRLAGLEEPQSPLMLPKMATADLSTTNAAAYAYRFVYVTTLNMTAHSNGVHWYRSDTGALII